MILAAGLGTRLKPLTDHKPKALVELNGTTLLEHAINKLSQAGIFTCFINVHHYADLVIDFLKSNNNFGIDIIISDERDRLLETGGGIKKVIQEHQLEEDLLVYNTDIITDLSIPDFISAHRHSKADATLSVKKRTSSRYLLFNPQMELCAWKHALNGQYKWRKKTAEELEPFAFSGIHIIGKKVQEHFQEADKFSIIDTYLQDSPLIIHGLDHSKYTFIDAGKPETLGQAEAFIKNQK